MNPTRCTRLATTLHCLGRCWTKFDFHHGKHRLQHRPPCLCFSGVNNNVAFVWAPCSTLLNTRMSNKLPLQVPQTIAIIYCLFLLGALPRECSSYDVANEPSFESLNDESLNTSDLLQIGRKERLTSKWNCMTNIPTPDTTGNCGISGGLWDRLKGGGSSLYFETRQKWGIAVLFGPKTGRTKGVVEEVVSGSTVYLSVGGGDDWPEEMHNQDLRWQTTQTVLITHKETYSGYALFREEACRAETTPNCHIRF